MSLKTAAENVLFGYPKVSTSQPSKQDLADLFQNMQHSRATVAELLADNVLSYAPGSIHYVTAGDYLEAGGHRYQVAASGATDHHMLTVGGVKLYARPHAGMVAATQVGVTFDGVTDDAAALNLGAKISRESGWIFMIDGTGGYAADTLFFGGATVWGQGGIHEDFSGRSRTIIFSDGNPAVDSAKNAATAQTFHQTHWRGWTIAAAGGAVLPIDLWDEENFPYQVGLWLGRNHNFMQKTDDPTPETSAGGVGGIKIDGVSVLNMSGWGCYCYKFWGLSSIENLFLRECGKIGAQALGDNERAGGLAIASGSVDFNVTGVHIYGQESPEYGCGIKIGAKKSATDALNRFWTPGGNQRITDLFVEGYPVPQAFNASRSTFGKNWTLEGGSGLQNGEIRFGDMTNPRNDMTLHVDGLKTFAIAAVEVQAPVSIEGYVQQENANVEWKYYAPFKLTRADLPVSWLNEEATMFGFPLTYSPQGDVSAFTAVSWNQLPFAVTDTVQASPQMRNLLPPFGAGPGSALNAGWSGDGVGNIHVQDDYSLRLGGGETATASLTGLTPGDVYTVFLWVIAPFTAAVTNVAYRVSNGTTDIVSRTLGGSGTTTSTRFRRQFNVTVPANGELHLHLTVSGGVQVYFETPIIVKGLAAEMGEIIDLWPTSEGLVSRN
ncbi:hypothetical protein [Leisingera aquaemixtae]|uniref:Pectate lyase superfamily protein n=1 Tax=Leisingera aquaemixtae TaxID=1396826 RepID=A0A0N7M510_9RHOB|nr:hypothetical protein [Leisingera aquaemixtae]CUI01130.1 hypothetical protein PHA8399_03271 [Leisingera aquaemixtae]